MSEESRQNYIPFTEPKPVTTVQGAEYAESVSPGGLIVLSETQAAPRMSPVAYIPPAVCFVCRVEGDSEYRYRIPVGQNEHAVA